MPYQPAVLGTARLNNFRLNYLTAAQKSIVRIILGGVDISQPGAVPRVIYKSMTIQDVVFDAPNTCRLTLLGGAPTVGQRLEIWLQPNDPILLFGGELQTVERTYKGRPSTVLHPCTAIDDTAAANRKRPLGQFTMTSATTVAQWLISTYAPGFSSAGVEANLPPVTVTFDGSEAGMKGCLTQVAKLIGGYWYFENKTLYLFVTPPGTSPDPIDDSPKRFAHDPAITWAMEKSQVRTRVYGKGASTTIATTIAAGTDLVPVREATMFNPTGGKAIAGVSPDGAACLPLTYTGVQLGGGGGLVGPGASPAAPPTLALAPGTEVNSGVHRYAVTFVTAAGESLAGPSAEITTGFLPSPTVAPTPGSPTAGGSIEAGTFQYGVTFVTASGETDLTVSSAPVTTTVGAGVPAPGTTSAALRKVSGNLGNGVAYRYETTITIAGGGETLPGAPSAAITPQPPATPSGVWGGSVLNVPGSMAPGFYVYALAYVSGGYETVLRIDTAQLRAVSSPSQGFQFTWFVASSDVRVTTLRLYRTHCAPTGVPDPATALYYLVTELANASAAAGYTDTKSDAQLGPQRIGTGAIGTPPGDQATVTVPTSGDVRAVGRRIYRSDNGAPFRRLATINNNTETSYIDTTASVATDPDAPTTDTSGGASYQTVPLTGIPIGPAIVTARRLYRFTGGPGWRVLATIANNTATTYTDTAPTSGLSGGMPTNTAAANRVTITVPIGGATVTGRNLYRTIANDPQLKLLTTIAENTSTSYLDPWADSVLAGRPVPPVTDTSGLTQPSGQVPPGATTIIVANTAPFATAGGWAVVGNGEQVIRYTGKTPTTLTGIPASGSGALVAAVSYNSTITAAPTLSGVAGVTVTILQGAPIHVWVQRDDIAAQAYMVALDGGGDGVYEHIVSDDRRSEASLIQICDAELALYSRPLVTVTYATRDLKTKSGKTVAITLTSPAINESLTIQDVAISDLGIVGVVPKFTVTASTVHHTFEAILQKLIRNAGA